MEETEIWKNNEQSLIPNLTTTVSSMKSHLPLEIINEILSRLPVKSLLRFLCVSKQWYARIKNQDFIKLHSQRSIENNRDRTLILGKIPSGEPRYFFSVHFPTENHFDNAFTLYPPLYRPGKYREGMLVSILDYCHGLVCIRNMLGEIAIWNPLIRKYRILPTEPILKPSYSYNSSSLAFGYDLCNDDYKVLRVTTFHNGGQPLNEFEVKVYSLRSHSWRKIEDQWPKKECTISSTSASLNGALHWLIAEGPVYDMCPLGPECLLAFDLATEKFRVFKTPVQQEFELATYLEVLKGQLCFIVSPDFETETGHDYNDVWLMKEYGKESSWTRIYKIVRRSVPWTFKYCKPLMFSENDKKVLLEMRQYNRKRQYYRTKLVWYDIEKKKGERVKIQNFPDSFETAICVGSLLLLDGDDVIDPAEQNNKRKRNESPSEVPNPNLLGKAVDELKNEKQEG